MEDYNVKFEVNGIKHEMDRRDFIVAVEFFEKELEEYLVQMRQIKINKRDNIASAAENPLLDSDEKNQLEYEALKNRNIQRGLSLSQRILVKVVTGIYGKMNKETGKQKG